MKSTRKLIISAGCSALVVAALMTVPVTTDAQKGGGGGGKGMPSIGTSSGRFDTFRKSFEMTKDQEKAVKTLLDEAHKAAAPIRDELTKTHAALGAAIQGNKGQAEIDAAAKAYAEQAAAMAAAEMKAMAGMMKLLTDQQRSNSAAISAAFFSMRGAFFDKKWDDVPDSRIRY